MKPSEFFETARMIEGAGGDHAEARQRTAVSRYYYSVFLDARSRLSALPHIRIDRHRAHDQVRRAFERATPSELKKIGRLLGDLKKMREDADYDIDPPFDSAAVTEARTLASDLQSYLATADLSHCVDPRKT